MEEKNCRNCKWRNTNECKCKKVLNMFNVNLKDDAVAYIEDGIFSESIKEGLDFEKLSNLITDKLKDEGYLKKTKKIEKFNIEDLEQQITEIIDIGLSRSILNYFSSKDVSLELNMENIRDFHCCGWE